MVHIRFSGNWIEVYDVVSDDTLVKVRIFDFYLSLTNSDDLWIQDLAIMIGHQVSYMDTYAYGLGYSTVQDVYNYWLGLINARLLQMYQTQVGSPHMYPVSSSYTDFPYEKLGDSPVYGSVVGLFVDQTVNIVQRDGTPSKPFVDIQQALDRAALLFSSSNKPSHVVITVTGSSYLETLRPPLLKDTPYRIPDSVRSVTIRFARGLSVFTFSKNIVVYTINSASRLIVLESMGDIMRSSAGVSSFDITLPPVADTKPTFEFLGPGTPDVSLYVTCYRYRQDYPVFVDSSFVRKLYLGYQSIFSEGFTQASATRFGDITVEGSYSNDAPLVHVYEGNNFSDTQGYLQWMGVYNNSPLSNVHTFGKIKVGNDIDPPGNLSKYCGISSVRVTHSVVTDIESSCVFIDLYRSKVLGNVTHDNNGYEVDGCSKLHDVIVNGDYTLQRGVYHHLGYVDLKGAVNYNSATPL